MNKSKLKEYKLFEDTNVSNGTKVSFKIGINTGNLQEDQVKENIINVINNDIVNNLNRSTTAVILKSRKNAETGVITGVSAEQSGRYNLKIKAGLDESSLKISKKSSKDNQDIYEATFTILLSPISRKRLKRDFAVNTINTVGNVAKTVVGAVANAGASMAPKMTNPYGN